MHLHTLSICRGTFSRHSRLIDVRVYVAHIWCFQTETVPHTRSMPSLSHTTQAAEAWFTMMCDNGFKRSAPLHQSMVIAISQTRRVSIGKVKQVVQLMEANGVEADGGLLAVLLKCCARSATPQPALASQWFRTYIPVSQLSEDIETELLPLTVGRSDADKLIRWAVQTYASPPPSLPPRTHHHHHHHHHPHTHTHTHTHARARAHTHTHTPRHLLHASHDGISKLIFSVSLELFGSTYLTMSWRV